MILQALTHHYEALAQKNEITELGWSLAKVSFALNISLDGELKNVISLKKEEERGKKKVWVPRIFKVPEQVKRASGIAPNFLCDSTAYVLGLDNKGKPDRTLQCFEVSKKHHIEILSTINSKETDAVIKFFNHWDPKTIDDNEILQPYLEDIYQEGNLLFYIDGLDFAQELDPFKQAWKNYRNEMEDCTIMQCLVTGEQMPIARLHPSIKGVRDAQSSGASLVSFNGDAYESYGHHGKTDGQGLNAPVSEYAAFAYGTALNHLLADKNHMQQIGDAAVVYWAGNGDTIYQDIFNLSLNPKDETENLLKSFFTKFAKGQYVDFNGVQLNTSVQFYILGLAPNAARLSVRFFIQDSFAQLLQNLKDHYDRLEIIKPQFDRWEYLSVWNLLQETVNKNSKDKSPSPLLSGATLRAIITGGYYPKSLLNAVIMRVRAEQDNKDRNIKKITRGRAAIIKAYLLKNSSNSLMKEVLTVGLNEYSTYLPYVLGRLFSVLEEVQQRAADGNLNSTIKDRYFNSACATPAVIFPVLLKLYNNHIRKMDNKGARIYFEQIVGKLMGLIQMESDPLPKHLSLEEQGVFILGYYHQTQKRFEGKNKEDK